MKVKKTEFWAMFYYGGTETICSRHRSYSAAARAAMRCEKGGGAKHHFVEVNYLDDPQKDKQSRAR